MTPYEHMHHHPPEHFKPSYVKETSKSVDICDKFDRLRYVVQLSSNVFYDRRGYKTVVSSTFPEGIVAFLEIPAGNDWEMDYTRAIADFNACVSKYQSLVNAEMRDFRDIDVYKDRIDYKEQQLSCCDTCKWCMKTFEELPYHHHCHGPKKTIKWQCCCPQNEQVFNYAEDYPQLPRWHGHGAWMKLPWQKPEDITYCRPEWDPRKFPDVVFPTVQQMGICEHYLSGTNDYGKTHRHEDNVKPLASTIAPAYTTALSCYPGDLVYYCGELYTCVSAHMGGAWSSIDFMRTTVDEELKSKATHEELSNALSASLSGYVRTDALSGVSIPEDPTQHQIADVVKVQLSTMGGTISD